MEKSIKSLVLALVCILFVTTIEATNEPLSKADFVINGRINHSGKSHSKKCKITLYHENTELYTIERKWGREFEFDLKKNVWYTIKVEREGFQDLMISINTQVIDNKLIRDNVFYFETAMISNEEAKTYNPEYLEFPLGHVEFNPRKGKLLAREAYTNNYFASIKNLNDNKNDLAHNNKSDEKIADIAMQYVYKSDLAKDLC
ncbi:MAG: hypothetical protein AB7O73_15460 [Bacteroidia bacterium]